jgi:glycosyltransferase involved in cell wall biosynthesis
VQFLGQRDDVPRLLKAADLFVSPSRNEGLPTATIEAGAAGLPSVATRVGGTGEIVQDGVTGLLVPPEDPGRLAEAAVAILADSDRRKRMGIAAAARVREHFTLQAQARSTARVYERVVARDA